MIDFDRSPMINVRGGVRGGVAARQRHGWRRAGQGSAEGRAGPAAWPRVVR
jgi:hypothetical protein